MRLARKLVLALYNTSDEEQRKQTEEQQRRIEERTKRREAALARWNAEAEAIRNRRQ